MKGRTFQQRAADAIKQGLGKLSLIRHGGTCATGNTDDVTDALQRRQILSLIQKDHRPSDCMNADEMVTPRIELQAIGVTACVLPGEFKQTKQMRGVTFGTGPVFQSKEKDQTIKVGTGFEEERGTICRGQLGYHLRMPRTSRIYSVMVEIEDRVRSYFPGTVGAPISLVLFQPHWLTNRDDLTPVNATRQTHVSVRIVRPALQVVPQVHDIQGREGLAWRGD